MTNKRAIVQCHDVVPVWNGILSLANDVGTRVLDRPVHKKQLSIVKTECGASLVQWLIMILNKFPACGKLLLGINQHMNNAVIF